MRNTVGTFLLGGMLAFGMAAGTALAQEPAAQPQGQPQGQWGHGRGGMNADEQLQHMTRELDLTADQQAQIKPILVARDQQRQQMMQDQSMAQEDRHAKMRAIQEDTNTKIEAALNDTQKQKFEAMHHHRGGPEGAGQAPPQ